MRLSTAVERDENRAIETIHAALDGGVTFLDTADAYCHDEHDIGHNERLIAAALRSWNGDASSVLVATKGGMTRLRGGWVPNGRAGALAKACEASLRALDVDCIDLYQLHVPDPKTALGTSVRALAKLRDSGLVRGIGLCNVRLSELIEAERETEIAAVQVELSVLADEPLRNGLAEYCRQHGIRLVAHSPLGGPRRRGRMAKNAALRRMADERGVAPEDVALGWLTDLDHGIVPIPGATRRETAARAASSQQMSFTADERAGLDGLQEAGRRWRRPQADRRPSAEAPADVVVLMGYPAAGKTTAVSEWVDRGYQRLNRDERGGTLAGLAKVLAKRLSEGQRRFVLDNTYASRASRNAVIETAWEHGLNARCVWLQTSIENAQVNAVTRMITKHGRLLDPDEVKAEAKHDPGTFPPKAQFDFRRALEEPDSREGFTETTHVPFVRQLDATHTAKALIVEYDGVLRRSRSGADRPSSPADVQALPGRAEALRRYQEDGWKILGVSWQPEVEEGTTTAELANAIFDRTHQLVGVDIDVVYCPHRGGPPKCWCRKPLPGLGVLHVQHNSLDPGSCLFVGRNPTDKLFAARLGFQYADADEFFEGANSQAPVSE